MKENPASISYIKIFLVLLVILIIASFSFRFYSLITSSSFRNNSFSILYISKDVKLISVNDDEKSVVFLSIGDVENIIKGKSTFVASVALGVPINGIIYDADIEKSPDLSDFVNFGNELRLITNTNIKYQNLNKFDLHKVFSIARDADKDNITKLKVDLIKGDFSELEEVFIDKTVRDSQHTIEVINGTQINGLAGSVASMLMKRGYNVIFLNTLPADYGDSSYIGYEFERDFFIDSVSKLTKFEENNKTVSKTADVTIYLGADLESQFNN